ncbi:protein-L-isoaspartate O-methyltransferase [Bradyrhizobium sp. LM3.2]
MPNPVHLQDNVLVAIDARRKLDTGLPSLWAHFIDLLDVGEKDRVVQIGCGLGYFSAVLSEIVGPKGRVHAIECDARLAARAATYLRAYRNVVVVHGDGCEDIGEPADVIIVHAGFSQPHPLWLQSLRPRGRLLVPLTQRDREGAALKITRKGKGFEAEAVQQIRIFPGQGSRCDRARRPRRRLVAAGLRPGAAALLRHRAGAAIGLGPPSQSGNYREVAPFFVPGRSFIFELGLDERMKDGLNEGLVGDTAKLMMHRLIVRRLRRDPSLVEKAKAAHARQADQFYDWPFVREWQELLALPTGELASRLTSRDREMVRLRNSSPFYLVEGVHFGDYDARIRLRRAARRVAERALGTRALSSRGP